jgi:O-methyltransferase domain/Dimerisation domain
MSTHGTPPALALLQQALGFWISRAICVVARLGIADLLKDGPLDTETLAAAAGVHAPSLYRVLRALAGVGIFAEGEDGRFGLTPQAEPLRSDAPDSIRDYILLVGEEWYSRPSDHLLHSVQTGRPAFQQVHGADFFTFLARDPAAAAVFDAAMTSRSAQENDAIAAACDFSGLGTIIDVGGGHGSLLAAILRANSGLRGVLFDRPQAVAEARHQLEAAGLGGRCEVVAGDFFVSVPAGGDAYILKRVIHDWDDERAGAILRNCHRAMPEHGRLLVIELVLPPGNDPSLGKLFDLLMLVDLGGRERTEADYRTLLAGAGFELTAVTPTPSLVSVVEGVRR